MIPVGEMLVLHTPGHSKGSISLLLHSEGALFCGDAIPVAGDLPVYEDAVASVQSVRRLHGLKGTRVLLSSWDEPWKGDAAHLQMDKALDYLQKIHEAVLASAGEDFCDLMVLTRKLPQFSVFHLALIFLTIDGAEFSLVLYPAWLIRKTVTKRNPFWEF